MESREIGTSIRAVRLSASYINHSTYLIHSVHNFNRKRDGSVRGFKGFAKIVSNSTVDLPERLAAFKEALPDPKGGVLVTFSPVFGTVFNLVSDRYSWDNHLLSLLLELPKVLPSGSQVHLPAIGCGVWQAPPYKLWRVLYSLPVDYPINLVLHDPEGNFKTLVATTPAKLPVPPMVCWQTSRHSLLVPYTTGSFVSNLIWAWKTDLDHMGIPLREFRPPSMEEESVSDEETFEPVAIDAFSFFQVFSMSLAFFLSLAYENYAIAAFAFTLLTFYILFLLSAIAMGRLVWKLDLGLANLTIQDILKYILCRVVEERPEVRVKKARPVIPLWKPCVSRRRSTVTCDDDSSGSDFVDAANTLIESVDSPG